MGTNERRLDRLKKRARDAISEVSASERCSMRSTWLAGDGEDLRPWPLALRKGALAGLLSDPVDGIFIAEYEQGEIGDILLKVACNIGLEGIASKLAIAPAGAGTGSRSRTARTRPITGSEMRWLLGPEYLALDESVRC